MYFTSSADVYGVSTERRRDVVFLQIKNTTIAENGKYLATPANSPPSTVGHRCEPLLWHLEFSWYEKSHGIVHQYQPDISL